MIACLQSPSVDIDQRIDRLLLSHTQKLAMHRRGLKILEEEVRRNPHPLALAKYRETAPFIDISNSILGSLKQLLVQLSYTHDVAEFHQIALGIPNPAVNYGKVVGIYSADVLCYFCADLPDCYPQVRPVGALEQGYALMFADMSEWRDRIYASLACKVGSYLLLPKDTRYPEGPKVI